MDLKIVAVHGDGTQTKEYVLLQVLKDCTLDGYVLADNTYDNKGRLSNKVRHTFWFPDKKVKAGEYVSVRTGKGNYELGETNQKKPLHRFYWNLDEGIWNDDGDCAVLLKVTDSSKKTAPPAKK